MHLYWKFLYSCDIVLFYSCWLQSNNPAGKNMLSSYSDHKEKLRCQLQVIKQNGMFYGERWHGRNIMSDQPDSLGETICCLTSLLCCSASKLSHSNSFNVSSAAELLGKRARLLPAATVWVSLRGFSDSAPTAASLLCSVWKWPRRCWFRFNVPTHKCTNIRPSSCENVKMKY